MYQYFFYYYLFTYLLSDKVPTKTACGKFLRLGKSSTCTKMLFLESMYKEELLMAYADCKAYSQYCKMSTSISNMASQCNAVHCDKPDSTVHRKHYWKCFMKMKKSLDSEVFRKTKLEVANQKCQFKLLDSELLIAWKLQNITSFSHILLPYKSVFLLKF